MTITKPFPDLQFERMQQEDLQQVMAIEKEAFPDPWHISFFKRVLRPEKKHTHLYVARLKNEVIGYIVLYINCGEAHIMNIAVASEYRRRGVAKYLFASVLEIAQKNEVDEVFLEVAVKNRAARRLYKHFGFEVCGIRKRYYPNGGRCLCLTKRDAKLIYTYYINLSCYISDFRQA